MRPLVENEPASCPEPRSSIIARIDHREEKSERHVVLVRFFFSTLRKKFLLSIERDNKSIQTYPPALLESGEILLLSFGIIRFDSKVFSLPSVQPVSRYYGANELRLVIKANVS